ncbi:hypothetical protein [Mycobacteroides abscessus]|uniref:hypothetical protein n=1 Tax=Mycobacteroides abscessus TaxID=36809 RepID=UPI0018781CBF
MTAADYYGSLPEAPDEMVMVRRSYLDPDIWYCVAPGMHTDISSLFSPGRIRAVKRYAEETFGGDDSFRWVRKDVDTWVMEFV